MTKVAKVRNSKKKGTNLRSPLGSPNQPFYNTPEYLGLDKRYVIKGLTGIEINLLRNAVLMLVRNTQDQALWENMSRYDAIKNKIDDAELMVENGKGDE